MLETLPRGASWIPGEAEEGSGLWDRTIPHFTAAEEEASSATGTTAASAVATPAYRRTSGDGA